jgi:hypothetical protein
LSYATASIKMRSASLKNATEAANAAPASPRFGTQEEFYKDLGILCQERDGQGRNITFYHYSGAAIETLVLNLYKKRFCITIYTQMPAINRGGLIDSALSVAHGRTVLPVLRRIKLHQKRQNPVR